MSCAGPFKLKMPGGGNEAEKRLRIDAIRRAEVWRPTRVASLDLEKGPDVAGGFAPQATVQCNYVDEKMSGRSPKFTCALGRNDEVKVKYGKTNGEVYAEVAATRLLWALGFGADRMYPVRVICRGCPADLEGAPTANRRQVAVRSRGHRAQDEGHGARVGRHGGLVVVGARSGVRCECLHAASAARRAEAAGGDAAAHRLQVAAAAPALPGRARSRRTRRRASGPS